MIALQTADHIVHGTRRILRGVGPLCWPGEWREALARWVILGLLLSVAVSALALHRWLMWVALALGLLITHQAGRAETADEETEPDNEAEPDWHDVVAALEELTGDDRGSVLLTVLRDELGVPDTKAVKLLLDEAGVSWRTGVRTRAGNGPGVHRDDLPPPSPTSEGAPVGVVGPGQDANTNANNALRVDRQEGFTIIHDPADAHRRHKTGDY